MTRAPFDELIRVAHDHGVSAAVIVPAATLPIDPALAELCRPPHCPNYGASSRCPPHGLTPADFQALVAAYSHALVFRIDAPTAMLVSDERRIITRLIHETVTAVEHFAVAHGYPEARGFAAGSCKELFCTGHASCNVLAGGACRFPDDARQSISGIGIDFLALTTRLGWHAEKIARDTDPEAVPMGMMVGILLIC